MQKYTQLTYEQRYHIYLLNKQGYNQTFIAKSMGRNKSTISRELSRNTGKRGYRHKQANRLAYEKHQEKNKAIRLTAEVKHYISEKLKEYWIPQQIVGRLALDRKIKISTETAYRVDIDQRPDVVDSRSRIGDWEVDLGDTKVALPLLLSVRVGYILHYPLSTKPHKMQMTLSINKRLTPLKHWVKTLTFDNGREFSWHEKLAENLDCNTYFAKPYHNWERGLNENHNGLLRQFLPKRMALRKKHLGQQI